MTNSHLEYTKRQRSISITITLQSITKSIGIIFHTSEKAHSPLVNVLKHFWFCTAFTIIFAVSSIALFDTSITWQFILLITSSNDQFLLEYD